MTGSKVRGVHRREGRCPGWVVRRWDTDKQEHSYLAFLSDSEHGGAVKARKEAEAYSVEHGDGWRTSRRRLKPVAGKNDDLPIGVIVVREKGKVKRVRAQIQVDGELYYEDFKVAQDPKLHAASFGKAKRKARAYRRRLEKTVFGQ